jgi:hypothetical protein
MVASFCPPPRRTDLEATAQIGDATSLLLMPTPDRILTAPLHHGVPAEKPTGRLAPLLAHDQDQHLLHGITPVAMEAKPNPTLQLYRGGTLTTPRRRRSPETGGGGACWPVSEKPREESGEEMGRN